MIGCRIRLTSAHPTQDVWRAREKRSSCLRTSFLSRKEFCTRHEPASSDYDARKYITAFKKHGFSSFGIIFCYKLNFVDTTLLMAA